MKEDRGKIEIKGKVVWKGRKIEIEGDIERREREKEIREFRMNVKDIKVVMG